MKPTVKPVTQSRQSPAGPTLAGIATWYGTGGPGAYVAMAGYRDGTSVSVRICAARCAVLRVVTQCGACRWARDATLVDLSIAAWHAVTDLPLSRGVVAVTVER